MSSDPVLLVYGASGFTGRLIVEEALALGLRCVLGGRTGARLEALARQQDVPFRVAALDDRRAVAKMLEGVAVVLNTAGPFHLTAVPLARACIETGVHYLDIAGEYGVFDALAALGADARARGAMLLPGAGFDVVASDCLAGLVARRVSKPKQLSIALRGLNAISRGSAASVFSLSSDRVLVRRGGELVGVAPSALTQKFDFGTGPTETTAVTWADISSAYHSTGIGDITVYYEATAVVRLGLGLNRYGSWLVHTPAWGWWQEMGVRLLPEGPTAAERAAGSADLVACVEGRGGQRAEARLHTPEVYAFTATTAAALATRALNGDAVPGFQTPATAYGADYVLSLPGVKYEEVPARAGRK